MAEQQSRKRTVFRRARRLLVALVAIIGVALIVSGVAVAATWGHFWEFRVGDPTSESCASCHVMEQYATSLTDSTLLASAHANRDVGCVDCHEYGLEQQLNDTIAYLTSDYVEPFPRTRPANETCFACHEHGSYDQLARRTADLGVTDPQAKGNDANPHQPPHYTDLECHSCHRMHRESTLLCWECHSYDYNYPYIGDKPGATPEPNSQGS